MADSTSLQFMDAFVSHAHQTKSNANSSYSVMNKIDSKTTILGRWVDILKNRPPTPKTWDAFMDQGYYKCTVLESVAFICGIEETIDRMESMGSRDIKPHSGLPDIKAPSTVTDYTRHRHIYDCNVLDTIKGAAPRYQKLKMQNNRHFSVRALTETRRDLINTGTFISLQETLGFLRQRTFERELIFQEKNDCKSVLKAQTAIINVEAYIGANAQITMGIGIEMLREKLHDSLVLCGACKRTVTKYEGARREQHIIKLQKTERELEETTKRNRSNILLDNRIDAEIVEYLLRQTRQLKNQIAMWSERYDEDIETLDTELLMKKETLENLQKDSTQMRSIFYNRQMELEDYLEIKLSREFIVKQAAMALMIQSWWRGLIHRNDMLPQHKRKKKK